MRRLLVLAALVAAVTAGAAQADVFAVVPDTAAAAAPAPSAATELPNAPGAVVAPAAAGAAQQLSYPQLVGIWQRAGAAYGIPWQVLGAINKVESNFGRNMGPSSAGAIGWMQFMPSTWARWGVDANQDGIADPWNAEDAVYSAARYLAAAGGRTDISRAVFAYNHAQWYVDEVLGLARTMDDLGADATFTVDQQAVQVGAAERTVAQTGARLAAAVRVGRRLAAAERRLVSRTDAAPLLSDQLLLQKLAAQAGERHDQAAALTAELQDKLDLARAALERARSAPVSASSPFAPGAVVPASTPVTSGAYVFPVGGGPSVVSVGHTQHDSPAADIAAPEGTPVYALTNAAVLSAWRLPDARCGIGFTMQTADGQAWTYCHLESLDPAVVEGALLTSGQSVGLVGQTGDATGPQLQLQLQPATAYPQDLPWFQSFAGTAFRWQDAAMPDAAPATAGPLFALVQPAIDGVITFSTR